MCLLHVSADKLDLNINGCVFFKGSALPYLHNIICSKKQVARAKQVEVKLC